MASPGLKGFLGSKAARILTLILLAQVAVLYGFSRKEVAPENRPLRELSPAIADWTLIQDTAIEQEVLDVLRADETLSRTYATTNGSGAAAHLFVAHFRTQRTGQAPHSPKNCLPGSGWAPSVNDQLTIAIAGRPAIEVNRYIIEKGEAKSLVLYWYQSRDRVIASEYKAKVYAVADAIRYNRSDTALVRVVIPVQRGDADAATQTAIRFIQAIFTPLRQHFPA